MRPDQTAASAAIAAMLRRIELAMRTEQICLDLSERLIGEARSAMLAKVLAEAAKRHQAAAELRRVVELRHAAARAVLARTEEMAA
jgi:hypothetical protein